MWDTSHVVFLKLLCWQQHENVSPKQGRLLFLESDRIPASTAAGHSRGFGGARHPSPEAILTGDSNGDFAPSFAKKSHNRRSQRPAARQQKWQARSVAAIALAMGIQPQRWAVTTLEEGEQMGRIHLCSSLVNSDKEHAKLLPRYNRRVYYWYTS